MIIEIKGLFLIITISSFCLIGIGATVYYVIQRELFLWEIQQVLIFIKKIPVFRTKKLRFEIAMITGWIRNKHGIRDAIKNFYAWGRIGKITENHKNYGRLRYLAAFSMGKPLESQLKENNRSMARRKKFAENIEEF